MIGVIGRKTETTRTEARSPGARLEQVCAVQPPDGAALRSQLVYRSVEATAPKGVIIRFAAREGIGSQGGDAGRADRAAGRPAGRIGRPDPVGLHAHATRGFPRRLRERAVEIDVATHVDHPEQDQQEDRQHERELDEGLAAGPTGRSRCEPVACSPHHEFLVIVVEPPAFVTLRVTGWALLLPYVTGAGFCAFEPVPRSVNVQSQSVIGQFTASATVERS